MQPNEPLFTLTNAARLLGMSPAQLRARTERGTGPIPTKVDYQRGRPRADGSRFQYAYRLTEIERWVKHSADYETAMSYWLGRLWYATRALSPAELRAQLDTLHAMLPELAATEGLSDFWANIGMVLLADSAARGVSLDPAADLDSPPLAA